MNNCNDEVILNIYEFINSYTIKYNLSKTNKYHYGIIIPKIRLEFLNLKKSSFKCNSFIQAYNNNDKILYEYLESLCDFDPLFYNVALIIGIKYDNYKLSNYCLEKGADNLEEAYMSCILSNKKEFIEYLFNHYQTRICLNNYLVYKNGQFKLLT